MAQTASCYVILKAGKRKGARCGATAKEHGLCGHTSLSRRLQTTSGFEAA